MKPRKPLPARQSYLKRSPIKRSNPKRQKRRFEENYGGAAYVELISTLPCAICGVVGFTVAAHLTARGAGGKANVIAPLCYSRIAYPSSPTPFMRHMGGWIIIGCHEKFDLRVPSVRSHEARLRQEAAERWKQFLATRKSA